MSVTTSPCLSCPMNWLCCEKGCCPPLTYPARKPTDEPTSDPSLRYEWQVVYFSCTLGSILFCCAWCLFFKVRPLVLRRIYCSFACCVRRAGSGPGSAGSLYPPPRYSRCGSFHQAPPPYSEVTSKPDLYPLVITCGEGEGKAGGNYLMVNYFRNYVIRPPGSLSATSTAESLNSSYLCSAANEANSVIPPPYSSASMAGVAGAGAGGAGGTRLLRSVSLTERRELAPAFRDNLISSPVQPLRDPSIDLELEMIDCELYCNGGCKPRLGPSPPVHRSPSSTEAALYEQETFALRHLFPRPPPDAAGTCSSPPQPTSPTQSRDSTLRRARRHKASLYMPLSLAYPAPRPPSAARSAPATPCASLVPTLLSFTQRMSSRSERFDEERDPLLAETEHHQPDNKF